MEHLLESILHPKFCAASCRTNEGYCVHFVVIVLDSRLAGHPSENGTRLSIYNGFAPRLQLTDGLPSGWPADVIVVAFIGHLQAGASQHTSG